MHITGSIDIENPDRDYLIILNRRGLTNFSPNLVNYVCDVLVVLNASENVLINQSKLTSRNVAKEALYDVTSLVENKVEAQKVVLSTIVNTFFNGKRKIFTASVRTDNVASFKKQKRET